jgi:hypothetical protein
MHSLNGVVLRPNEDKRVSLATTASFNRAWSRTLIRSAGIPSNQGCGRDARDQASVYLDDRDRRDGRGASSSIAIAPAYGTLNIRESPCGFR